MDGYTIWEHLDRSVATNDWYSMFLGTKVFHLDVTTSDHKPLRIAPEGMNCCLQKSFCFEQMWLTDNGCTKTVEAVWCESSMETWDTKVIKKIDKCLIELTRWSKQHFGSVRKELEKKKKRTPGGRKEGTLNWGFKAHEGLEKEVNLLLDKEAKMWAQRSKVLWLKDGDRNSKFFHSRASQCRRQNYITKIHDNSGRLCTRPSQVIDIITNFYQELFTTGGPYSFEEVTDTIP
nr:uncharacterized protein LOC112025077 [Quercus suber]